MFDKMAERIPRAIDGRDMMGGEENRLLKELTYPIILCERIRAAAEEAESYRADCAEVGKRVENLAQMLRSIFFISKSTPTIYDRPIRRVASEAVKNLERALTLVRKCRRAGILRRVVTIINLGDFRKALSLLDASLGDVDWLLSVFNSDPSGAGTGGGASIVLGLPPIASIDPILAWVWSYVAVIQTGGVLAERVEAANSLASLASDNDRNKKIIIEEGGIPPLLKLLNEAASPESQIAAATALANLATDTDKACQIASEHGVPIIVQVLADSPMRVQVCVASLVARMARNDAASKEEFARENAIRPLVSLLCSEVLDDPHLARGKPTSFHSLVQINKEMAGYRPQLNSFHSEGSGSGRGRENHRKERENESPQVKLNLKVNCAEALWMLARGSIANSRRITETKGLLCLARIIEKEQDELRFNCLMTVMEIASAAESNAELRRSAFKTNSPPAKAVVDQLLKVIQDSSNPPTLQIPAIKSIGSLARTFPARETRVIKPLVNQLSHRNTDVAAEAAVALAKFTCPENFLHVEHSKAIIEFDGVPPLMRLLRSTEKAQLHGLILLCYLALHVPVPNSEALQEARALTALELASRSPAAQHPSIRELLPAACHHLELFHAGPHCLRPI
ncbi:hypothetical protein AAC387_Pa02g3699 [Persea americana]